MPCLLLGQVLKEHPPSHHLLASTVRRVNSSTVKTLKVSKFVLSACFSAILFPSFVSVSIILTFVPFLEGFSLVGGWAWSAKKKCDTFNLALRAFVYWFQLTFPTGSPTPSLLLVGQFYTFLLVCLCYSFFIATVLPHYLCFQGPPSNEYCFLQEACWRWALPPLSSDHAFGLFDIMVWYHCSLSALCCVSGTIGRFLPQTGALLGQGLWQMARHCPQHPSQRLAHLRHLVSVNWLDGWLS